MSQRLRLDKYLADMGLGTRNEVKQILKKSRIEVNGNVVRCPETKIDTGTDRVALDGNEIGYQDQEYFMLNKPAGVVSATEDRFDRTVLDLLADIRRRDLFPVGRLDKDTEGLLLITNDGELAHRLLSPKKHVAKVYYARIDGTVTSETVEIFRTGIGINEDFTALPAELKIIKSGKASEIELTIYEGKFHQVKRMFEAVGMKVMYLKRLSMGSLVLDPALPEGAYRRLTLEELALIRQEAGM